MKNKITTTILLSILAVTIVLSAGVHALVTDEDTTNSQTSAPITVEAPETVGEENNSTDIQNNYPLTQDYIDLIYKVYCAEGLYGGISFPETDGLHGPGSMPYTNQYGRQPMDHYVLYSVLECYGRPGEDRPIKVCVNGEVVEIPYDEIDPELKQAVTLRYRRYQEILEGGKKVPLSDYHTDEHPGDLDYGSYFGALDCPEDFYPSASAAFDVYDSVFQGKVVGISFEAKLAFNGYNYSRKELFTVYEVEVINTYQGSTDARIQIKIPGGHPTYGIDEQRKALDDIGLEMIYVPQSIPERVLELNETYVFTADIQYGVAIFRNIDYGVYGGQFYSVPFAFQPSTPDENGAMAVPDPDGPVNYENIMAYINSKSNEVDK